MVDIPKYPTQPNPTQPNQTICSYKNIWYFKHNMRESLWCSGYHPLKMDLMTWVQILNEAVRILYSANILGGKVCIQLVSLHL